MNQERDLKGRLIALTRDLALIPSTHARSSERARCVHFIHNHIEPLASVRIDHYESNGYTSLVAMPAGVARPDVLMCGHLDVVEHSGLQSYPSTIREGKIHGPGVGDMKGALAIMLTAFRALHEEHPGLSLGMAITSDEEQGGENGVRFLFEDVGLRCGVAIVPDGGSLNEVTVEEKGVLHLRIVSTGRAAHAARPWQGVNALHELTRRLIECQAHFPDPDVDPDGGSDDVWSPTCSVTIITTSNITVNRIPDHAEAVLDIRFLPPNSSKSVMERLHSVFDDRFELHTLMAAEPTSLAPDELFCEITEQITGRPVSRVRIAGGSDARFIRTFDIPVNVSRPLVGNLHTEEEWIDIESMVSYYHVCESYIKRRTLGIGSPQCGLGGSRHPADDP